MQKTTFILVTLFCLSGAASNAQSAPAASPMALINSAAEVASNVQDEPLYNYSVEYFNAGNWDSGMSDGLFGAFIAVKPQAPGGSVVCLVSDSFLDVICVYFDNQKPTGYVVQSVGPGDGFVSSKVLAAYQPVTAETVKKHFTFEFTQGTLRLDDGTDATVYVVSRISK